MYQNDKDHYSPYYEPPAVQRGGLYQADGLRDGVIVPGLQAVITGVLSGMAAGAITAWFALPFWAIGGTAALVVMAVSWMSYRGRWQFVLEKITGADINLDGYIGAPPMPTQEPLPEPPQTTRVIVENPEGTHADYIDLPYPEKLAELASGLLQGKVFAQTVWTGHSGTYSRSQFDQLRGEMIRRGLARWKNPEAPAQGCELTAKGRAVMRALADTPTLPRR